MLTQEILKFFFDLLYRESGLVLDESKKYLIEARLEPLAVQEGFPTIAALGQNMIRRPNPVLRQKVVDAMTTNETSFFRDQTPFTIMKETVLPELIKRKSGQRMIRIWCAASSTGQEPYSIAMGLSEMGPKLFGWDVKIMASDICEKVLNKARMGVYSQHEVQRGLPMPMLIRFFEQSGTNWKIKADVKKYVEYRKLNLLTGISKIGPFDVIFCRNILIYFDEMTKKKVLDQMVRVLTPGGILFLGGSETLLRTVTSMTRVGMSRGSYYKMAS